MFDAKDAQLLSLEFKAVDKNNDGTISYEELK
jgi:Ca2+-binding EF-hand superfamily protein